MFLRIYYRLLQQKYWFADASQAISPCSLSLYCVPHPFIVFPVPSFRSPSLHSIPHPFIVFLVPSSHFPSPVPLSYSCPLVVFPVLLSLVFPVPSSCSLFSRCAPCPLIAFPILLLCFLSFVAFPVPSLCFPSSCGVPQHLVVFPV